MIASELLPIAFLITWTILVFRFGRWWGGMARHHLDREQVLLLLPQVLEPGEALPGYQIIQRIERREGKSVDPSTLHYAMARLEERGLMAWVKREVDVPGPLGTIRRETRYLHYVTRSLAEKTP